MSPSFEIDYEWLPGGYGDEIERLTLAELTINVGDYCATEVEDILAKTVRSSTRLSAVCLAEWFAANWWRLLWEPEADTYSWRAAHRVGNAGRGYVWPDLSFSSDWQSVLIRCRPTSRCDAEPVRYLNKIDIPVPASAFEQGVDHFINGTIARIASTTKRQSDLSRLWDDIVTERHDPILSARRALEACMGYDPEEAPPGLLDSLQEGMQQYGTSAVQEVAAASRAQTISHIHRLWDDAQRKDLLTHVPKAGVIRQRLQSDASPANVPWQRATRAAQIARDAWGLEVPVKTESLCDLFSLPREKFSESQSSGGPRSLIAGFRDPGHPDAFRLSWSTKRPSSRRFALARLVADHIVTCGEENLLPGTGSATSRQKFQRAFAQEFLCPFKALESHLGAETPGDDVIDDAAQYFEVSPLTVRTTLVNKGVLGRETLPDWAV